MKLIKGLGLLSFIIVLSGSCFDAPEFPVIPEIEFDRIEIIHSANPGDFDTLNLYIKFKDGDGDLGFTLSPKYLSDPYHNANFYQEDAGGKLIPLGTEAGTIGEDEYELLHIPDPQKGKLVVFRTRKKTDYSFLPPADRLRPCLLRAQAIFYHPSWVFPALPLDIHNASDYSSRCTYPPVEESCSLFSCACGTRPAFLFADRVYAA
ncbi:MAG: hypothetical protein M3Y60_06900, partial [Bacteroidota bacterium]|nr:hypothetical protein [Bacteroidota bacterium]